MSSEMQQAEDIPLTLTLQQYLFYIIYNNLLKSISVVWRPRSRSLGKIKFTSQTCTQTRPEGRQKASGPVWFPAGARMSPLRRRTLPAIQND
jgi:hypothetical protein